MLNLQGCQVHNTRHLHMLGDGVEGSAEARPGRRRSRGEIAPVQFLEELGPQQASRRRGYARFEVLLLSDDRTLLLGFGEVPPEDRFPLPTRKRIDPPENMASLRDGHADAVGSAHAA